ncbi:MAG: 3-mercaptopyruvate sulfurtransferase [Xanthobacter sp.]
MSRTNLFVSTAWLAAHQDDANLVVVDGSWHMPATGRLGAQEFEQQHIPGAVHFDIDAIADLTSDLPHMVPTPEAFARAAGALGIGDGKTIVVYDTIGLLAVARVWWTLRLFGLENVFILEGGLPRWREEGRPVESGLARPVPAVLTPRFNAAQVADAGRVAQALETADAQVLDARPAARFRGDEPEPRIGVRAGHMPGALNLPASCFIEKDTLVSPEQVRMLMETAGVDLTHPVITSCGSGVTAAILWLALESIGHTPEALYDGSWTEWGGSEDRPVITG